MNPLVLLALLTGQSTDDMVEAINVGHTTKLVEHLMAAEALIQVEGPMDDAEANAARQFFQKYPAHPAANMVGFLREFRADYTGKWNDFTLELLDIVIAVGEAHMTECTAHDPAATQPLAEKMSAAFLARVKAYEDDWDQQVEGVRTYQQKEREQLDADRQAALSDVNVH
jgi:hypothetical protein